MQVHRCRFTDYVPQAINAMEFTPRTWKWPLLAVGRGNGDIELWRVKRNLVYEKTIPGLVNGSLETLAWAHQTELTQDDMELFDTKEEQARERERLRSSSPRLFSAGLNAVIVEWDLATLTPRRAVDSYGGAVWCMAVNNAQTQLAVGTEDGHIRIFDIADGELAYVRCYDRVRSRILAVAWGADDATVVTGSADGSVRVWGADGHVATRMTVPKEGAEATLVWAVAVLRDGTVVSGDSRGHVMFWDAAMRVVQQDFKALGADVLSLAVDRAGHTVFASGVDPKITQFRLFVGGAEATNTTSMAPRKWQLTGFRRYHTHDVRALALETSKGVNLLASGGVDTQVTAMRARSFPDRAPHRQPCFPPLSTVASVAPQAGLVLQRQGTQLKVWALGQAAPLAPALAEQMESGTAVAAPTPADLLRMDVKTRTSLTCSAISASGQFILASDAVGPKLFHVAGLQPGSDRVRVKRVRCFPPADFVPAESTNRGVVQARFTSDESRVVLATADAYVVVVDVSQWQQGRTVTERRLCAHRCTEAETAADALCDD
ncbi:U3 small nucleolar RNA-associated protein, partial [Linderina pennispora]